MSHTSHNLLLPQRRRTIRAAYYTRLLGVGMLFVSVVVALGVVALVPAYMLVYSVLDVVEQEIGLHQNEMINQEVVRTGVAQTTQLLGRVAPHVESTRVTEYIADVLQVRSPHIRVTGLTYKRAENRLALQGHANTRQDLASFVADMKTNPRFLEVKRPISDLAENIDLSFSITIALAADSSPAAYE